MSTQPMAVDVIDGTGQEAPGLPEVQANSSLARFDQGLHICALF